MAETMTDLELSKVPGEFEINRQDEAKVKKNEESVSDIPAYKVSIDLTEAEKERLTKQVEAEFKALKEERKNLGLEQKWKSLDNLYNGELKPNRKLHFNLHCHQAKIKEDAIVQAVNEAFLDSDPIVDVSPRPEFMKEGGKEVCDKQAQFLDYEMDENIKPAHQFILINRDSYRKFVGIAKLEWSYKKDRRKREEVYEGKWEPKVDENNQPIMRQDGTPELQNKAMEDFLSNYPDAAKRYPNILKSIAKGNKETLVVDYFDVTENNAKIRHVAIEDFYVCNSCEGNWGLKTAFFVGERQSYRWQELEEKQENEEFENIDALIVSKDDGDVYGDFRTKDYTAFEFTTFFTRDGAKESIKIKCWYGEKGEKKDGDESSLSYLGCIFYPYFGFDIDYVAFYMVKNNDGFYGNGHSVAETLLHSNIAQDAILNLSLHSAYIRNVLTPICPEGSEIEAQFLENRWFDGKPLTYDPLLEDASKSIGFVQYPQFDISQLLTLDSVLKRIDSDVTKATDLMTGRESPADPNAPAAKTIALLNQSGQGIKDYIRVYIQSFNILMSNLLSLYYQMSKDERKFRVNQRSGQVTGENPFDGIRRDMMIARTTIQARAASFAFDKQNEKAENMAAYQLLMTNPYAMQQPDILFEALKTVMESWSPTWKNLSDKLLDPQQFKQKMGMVAVQAVQALVAQQQFKQQATGIPGEPMTPDQAGAAVGDAQMKSYNPALAEENKK